MNPPPGESTRPLGADSGTRPSGLPPRWLSPHRLCVCVTLLKCLPDLFVPPLPHLYHGGNARLVPTMG